MLTIAVPFAGEPLPLPACTAKQKELTAKVCVSIVRGKRGAVTLAGEQLPLLLALPACAAKQQHNSFARTLGMHK
jgi:hypothetical protein